MDTLAIDRRPHRPGEKRPAYARICDTLRASIEAGTLPPGAVLLEGPLAHLFGSSRSPVKQALAQLESEGLARRFEGRGLLAGAVGAPLRLDLGRQHLTPDGADEGGEPDAATALYYVIEQEILLRSLFGRFRVNELALARHHGIGRTVARDLLQKAQQAGIVVKEDAHWWTVPLDEGRLRDLYRLRELLEPAALVEAAGHLPNDVLGTVAARLTAAIGRFPRLSIGELNELEQDIHATCLGFCPNRAILEALHRSRASLISGKHMQSILMGPEGTDPFLEEHAAIVSALQAGRADAAAAALLAHLSASREKGVERLAAYHRRFSAPAIAYIMD